MPVQLPAKCCPGFTLIELLVVVLLVGIITTMGVLNLADWLSQREAKQDARMLQDKIRMLVDDAVIGQLSLALRVNADHIKIYERNQSGWQESLRNQQGLIKPGRGVRLSLLNQTTALPSIKQKDEKIAVIYLGSDGRVSPYRLRVKDSQTYCDLTGDMAGNMAMECAPNQ